MKTVFDVRTYESPPSRSQGCRVCGKDVELISTGRRYCSPAHQRLATEIRQGRAPGVLREHEDGRCDVCGEELEHLVPAAFCSERHRTTFRRKRTASRNFVGHVRQPHWSEEWKPWLAPKLGLQADDPRLGKIAVRLALAGKLVVLVDSDGRVKAAGKPR